MTSKDGLNSELESFRQEWLSDLHSRRDEPGGSSQSAQSAALRPNRRHAEPPKSPTLTSRKPQSHHYNHHEVDDHYVQGPAFDEPAPKAGNTLSAPSKKPAPAKDESLVTALDHYESAMEREAQGNMGESLKLYRKAYRLDAGVDKRYREKHFPASSSTAPKPAAQPAASSAAPAASAPSTAEQPPAPLAIGDLLASFATLKIEPQAPEVEGMPEPPCPIASLPDELMVHILQDVATDDVGDFARLALVCKHFAYLVAAEQRIWRRVCLGDEFGFQAMHYHWQSTIEWQPLDQLEQQQLQLQEEDNADGTLVSLSELADRRRDEIVSVSRSLISDAVYPDWKHMFRSRPRVRFNGCYISTVNYVRSGQASTNQLTWGGAPIHIVTYYRYLRFFRDGTAISLLTTTEPTDVVHHLTRENLEAHRRRGAGQHALTHLPSVVMQHALRGRWRLSSALDHPDATAPRDQEGDLFVETEGVDPKYMYRMHLTLRSAGKLGRNNKAAWRSFHSHNKLTDDWAEFGLKNDKAFFFSRVKSYGVRGA